MKKMIMWLLLLAAVAAWWFWAAPPDDVAFDSSGETSTSAPQDATDETESVARELTEDEQGQLDAMLATAKDGAIKVVVGTTLGNITLALFPNVAPGTVDNFLTLAGEGFYDGTAFHRVIANFMIQGGDPNSKDDDRTNDGQGGPGYAFNDEINPHALGLSVAQIASLEEAGYVFALDIPSLPVARTALAMANSGPNTNGSQFFIVTEEEQTHLNGRHTVFGEVTGGMDIVRAIAAVETDSRDNPVEPIMIERIDIVE